MNTTHSVSKVIKLFVEHPIAGVEIGRYLTWDVASIEGGRSGNIEKVRGGCMDVDVEERRVAVEESLPEGQHGQGTPGEKHESHFGYSHVRIGWFLGDQGSSPEKLLIGHGMAEVVGGGMKKGLHVERRWLRG